MFRKITSIVIAATAAATLYAAPAMIIKCEGEYEFRTASPADQKLIKWVDGGVTGKCCKITCPKDMKKLVCHIWTQPLPEVKDPSANLRVTIFLKGKGTGVYGMNLRNAKKGGANLAVKDMEKFTVNSPDKWVKFTFDIVPGPKSGYKETCKYLLPMLILDAGGEIYMDDFSVEFIPAAK